jgi:RNA polymerase sigma factor (sigma-70 family)
MEATLAEPLPGTGDGGASAHRELESLYRDNRDDVYAYVAGLLRDRSTAEDVTAQAFERALRRRHGFDPRRGSGRAWLFGIARNAALERTLAGEDPGPGHEELAGLVTELRTERPEPDLDMGPRPGRPGR